MNTVLSFIIIALLVICLIMLIMIYSKKGTSSGELIKQQIELSSKATDDKISKLSSQMGALTDKNYEQQIKLIETLNVNSQKQMQPSRLSVCNQVMKKSLNKCEKPLMKSLMKL